MIKAQKITVNVRDFHKRKLVVIGRKKQLGEEIWMGMQIQKGTVTVQEYASHVHLSGRRTICRRMSKSIVKSSRDRRPRIRIILAISSFLVIINSR